MATIAGRAHPQYKLVKVMVERTYMVPISRVDPARTEINGWNMEQVCKSWFQDYTADQYHASRDAHRCGERFVDVHVTNEVVG